MSLINLQSIRKVYGEDDSLTIALDDIALSINAKEFVAIVGPSGSGKSTLMHIMGLLDRPSEGSYELDGQVVSALSQKALAHLRLKKIGFVLQSFNLLGRVSALDNVMLPMVYAGRNRSSRERRARELLDRVGLSDRRHHMPNQLSGGQIQRVAIARALANSPDIIFADEPTGNLDSQSGIQVLDILKDLNRDGTTVILVTHDEQIASAAKRTITMLDGRITNDSAAKKKPANKKSTKKTAKKPSKRNRSKKS